MIDYSLYPYAVAFFVVASVAAVLGLAALAMLVRDNRRSDRTVVQLRGARPVSASVSRAA